MVKRLLETAKGRWRDSQGRKWSQALRRETDVQRSKRSLVSRGQKDAELRGLEEDISAKTPSEQ